MNQNHLTYLLNNYASKAMTNKNGRATFPLPAHVLVVHTHSGTTLIVRPLSNAIEPGVVVLHNL